MLPGLAAALAAGMVMFSAAQASTGTTVSVSSANGTVGNAVTSTVAVSTLAALDSVNAFDITLSFNRDVVLVTAAAAASGWQETGGGAAINNGTGTIQLAGSRAVSCTTACTLFTVTWQIIAPGTASIMFAGSNTLAGHNQSDGGGAVTFTASGATVSGAAGTAATATSTGATATATAATATPRTTPAGSTGTTLAANGTTTATAGARTSTATNVPATRTPTPAAPATGQAVTSAPGNINAGPTVARGGVLGGGSTPDAPIAGTLGGGSGDMGRPFEPLGYGAILLALLMSAALAFGPSLQRANGRRAARPVVPGAAAVIEPPLADAIRTFLEAAERRGRLASRD